MGRADDPAETDADRFAAALSTDLHVLGSEALATNGTRLERMTETRIHRSTMASPGTDPSVAPAEPPTRVRRSVPPASDPLGGTTVTPEIQSRIHAAGRGGTPLPTSVQAAAERRSGARLGGVRIHTGREVDDVNRSLHASAFTVGSDIYLGTEAGNPTSGAGAHVLAHELGHVVQSSGTDQVHRWFGDSKSKKGVGVTGSSGELEQSNGLSKAEKANQKARHALGETNRKKLQADLKPMESALKKLLKNKQHTDVDFQAAGALHDKAEAMLKMMPGASTRGAQKTLGVVYPEERKRLRRLIGEAQLIVDENRVAATKQAAQNIYLGAGQQPGAAGGLAQLSDQAKSAFGVGAGAGGDVMQRIQAAGAGLGLSPAEIAAIYTFTAEDYRYINPATANSDGWMRGANPDLIDKPNLSGIEQGDREESFKITSEQDQKTARAADLKSKKSEGSLHAGVAMAGLAKLPVWKGSVFRSEVVTQADFDAKFETVAAKRQYRAKDKTIERDAISSSSKDRQKAQAFWPVAWPKVPAPKVRIIWEMQLTNGRDIELISANTQEQEVALLAGARLSIQSVVWEGTERSNWIKVTCKQTR